MTESIKELQNRLKTLHERLREARHQEDRLQIGSQIMAAEISMRRILIETGVKIRYAIQEQENRKDLQISSGRD